MTRHAKDLKPLLQIISGENASKLKLDEHVDIKKLKIFYQIDSESPLTDPVDKDIVSVMHKVVEYFEKQHNIKAEEKKIDKLRKSIAIWLTTMKTQRKFGELIMKKESVGLILLEILKNIVGLSGNTFIGLVTALFDYTGVKFGDEKYQQYLKHREDLENVFKNILGDDGVFLYPSHPTTAPYHNEPLVKAFNFSYTAIINSLGLPATTIPLGLGRDGLPIGMQVIANHNNDRLCFAVAEELDRAFGGWIEPQRS